jgi:hypothetical protein
MLLLPATEMMLLKGEGKYTQGTGNILMLDKES